MTPGSRIGQSPPTHALQEPVIVCFRWRSLRFVYVAMTDLDALAKIDGPDHAYARSGHVDVGTEVLALRRQQEDGSDRFALGVPIEVGYAAVSVVELLGTATT